MRAIGVAGYSGSGKTTLLEQLIPALGRLGQRVSVIKHAHHDFDVDVPGKDSWRYRQAGALEVLVASDRRLALMREYLAWFGIAEYIDTVSHGNDAGLIGAVYHFNQHYSQRQLTV